MEEPSPTTLKEIAQEAALLLAGIWALLKFVFEPRLNKVIEEKADERVADVATQVTNLEARMEKVERDAQQTTSAVNRIADDVGRLARVTESMAREVGEQSKSLSYIEGTMRARAPRDGDGSHGT